MADQRIGAAFIEVATKGLAKVQSDLNKLKEHLDKAAKGGEGLDAATEKGGKSAVKAESAYKKLGDTINNIGSIATKVFFGGIAAVGGFVRMADPRGFDNLTVALASVSIQLGRFFVPLLREVTGWIQKLANWLKGLSDQQRAQILHWVKIALVVAGVLAILPKLIAAFRLVMTVIRAVGATLTFATGGLSLLVGLIAVAIAALAEMFASGETGGGGMFGPIIAGLKALWDVVVRVFTQIAAFVGGIIQRLVPVFEGIVAALEPVFSVIMSAVAVVVDLLAPAFSVLGAIIETVIAVLGGIVEIILAVVTPVFRLLAAILKPIIWVLGKILGPAFEFLGTVIKMVANFFIKIINAIISAMNAVLEYVPGTDYIGGRRDYQIAEIGAEAPKAEKKEEKKDSNEFRGEVRQKAPELVGIAELWKKLQTAQSEDVQSRVARETLEESRNQGRTLDQIRDNTRPRNGWEGTGGNF
jgi:phage-related protein